MAALDIRAASPSARYVAMHAEKEPSSPPSPAATEQPDHSHDLEIKDSALIFKNVWHALEAEFPRSRLRFPKEIILLGGAPGSGKGTNTEFILEARGLTCPFGTDPPGRAKRTELRTAIGTTARCVREFSVAASIS